MIYFKVVLKPSHEMTDIPNQILSSDPLLLERSIELAIGVLSNREATPLTTKVPPTPAKPTGVYASSIQPTYSNRYQVGTTGKLSTPLDQEVAVANITLPSGAGERKVDDCIGGALNLQQAKATLNNLYTIIRANAQHSTKVERVGAESVDEMGLSLGPIYMVKYVTIGKNYHAFSVYGNCRVLSSVAFLIHEIDVPNTLSETETLSQPLPNEFQVIEHHGLRPNIDERYEDHGYHDMQTAKSVANVLFTSIRKLGQNYHRIERIGPATCLEMGMTDPDPSLQYCVEHMYRGPTYHQIRVLQGRGVIATVQFMFYGELTTPTPIQPPSDPDFRVPYGSRNHPKYRDLWLKQNGHAPEAVETEDPTVRIIPHEYTGGMSGRHLSQANRIAVPEPQLAAATSYPSNDSSVTTSYSGGGVAYQQAHRHLTQNPVVVSIPLPQEILVTNATRTPVTSPPLGEEHTDRVALCNLPAIKDEVNKILGKIRMQGQFCERAERIGPATVLDMGLNDAGGAYQAQHYYIGNTHHSITVWKGSRIIAEVELVFYGSLDGAKTAAVALSTYVPAAVPVHQENRKRNLAKSGKK